LKRLPTEIPNIFPVAVELVWPVRPNVYEQVLSFTRAAIRFDCEISFPNLYEIGETVILNGSSWSRVRLSWMQPFQGGEGEFRQWCSDSNGVEKLLLIAEQAQNHLIDFVKESSPKSPDLACIRHFGPIDWPLRKISVGPINVHLQINDSVGSQFRSQKSPLVTNGATIAEIPFSQRSLRRASDLISSGYPTEGALISIAVLDAYVQAYLTKQMQNRGVSMEAAEALLRNTTTKRLTTYLDPVLKLTTQHSLQQDDGELFKELGTINYLRNQAIHNGRDLTRKEAARVLTVTRRIMQYLAGIA
jgi:hypothetical protein